MFDSTNLEDMSGNKESPINEVKSNDKNSVDKMKLNSEENIGETISNIKSDRDSTNSIVQSKELSVIEKDGSTLQKLDKREVEIKLHELNHKKRITNDLEQDSDKKGDGESSQQSCTGKSSEEFKTIRQNSGESKQPESEKERSENQETNQPKVKNDEQSVSHGKINTSGRN